MDLMTLCPSSRNVLSWIIKKSKVRVKLEAAVEESLLLALFMVAIAIETCRSTLAQ